MGKFKALRFLFIVQGEGRGHMTQAIALKDELEANGHSVITTLIGTNKNRNIPAFLRKAMQGNVHSFASPSFITDKRSKGIKILKTILYNLCRFALYLRSMRYIDKWMKEKKPDVIINFYDFLPGLYVKFYNPNCQYICIGHQYLAKHPDFPFAGGKVNKWLFQFTNFITSLGATNLIALSYRPYPFFADEKLIVSPPLLRAEIKNLKSESGEFYLAYMVYAGYGQDIIEWHSRNQEVKIECFWNHPDHTEPFQPHPNLTFHPINDKLFLEKLSQCKAYICTAGFESVCEALYLNKQVMMVPVHGQYEQACNALDASQIPTVIHQKNYSLDPLMKLTGSPYKQNLEHKEWIGSGANFIARSIENICAKAVKIEANEDSTFEGLIIGNSQAATN